MIAPSSRRHLVTVSVLAATLLVGTTSGAVAGSIVTGRQIKDHSVQTKDLSRATVSTLSRIQGYERRRGSVLVEPAAEGIGSASCPPGKRVLGGDAYFRSTFTSLPLQISADGRGATAYGVNHYDVPDHLYVDLVCATVGSVKALPSDD